MRVVKQCSIAPLGGFPYNLALLHPQSMDHSEHDALVVPEMQTLEELTRLEQTIMGQVQNEKMSDELLEQVKFIIMLRRASDFGVFLTMMEGLTLSQLIKLVGALEGIHTARAAMRNDKRIQSILELSVRMPPKVP